MARGSGKAGEGGEEESKEELGRAEASRVARLSELKSLFLDEDAEKRQDDEVVSR